MVTPSGFSVVDFIAGTRVLKNVVDAVLHAVGAKRGWIELRTTLDNLSTALDATNQYTNPEHQAAVQQEVGECGECNEIFLSHFAGSQLLLIGPERIHSFEFAMRRLQWYFRAKKSVEEFKGHLDSHVDALQLQLKTFQM
jgi:hypothetical protein